MYFLLWIKRFFLSRRHFIRFTPLVSIFSLILATASLVLVMSVYSGYETTVKRAIVDMTGHLVVMSKKITTEKKLLNKIKAKRDQISSYAPFLSLKALLTYNGRLSGVLVEGIDSSKIHQTLQIKKRLISGNFELTKKNSAVIGKGLAKKFSLKLGDTFILVSPEINSAGSSISNHQSIRVEGILDFGFHEFNSRHILINIQTARDFIGQPIAISGLRFLLKNSKQAENLRFEWAQRLGLNYRVSDWQSIVTNVHASYFHAVRQEKFLIFFILMILVLAGAFNVSSHLSISVLNQIREISILKAMGASSIFIFILVLIEGVFISLIGTSVGIGTGWLLSKLFVGVQNIWQLIPSDVYKINTIITDVRVLDLFFIFLSSQVICFLSCIFPAWRALKLSVTEGLACE